MRNYGRKVIWSLFFPPVVLLPGCILQKKCIFTSEHQTTGRITFQLFRSGLQIFSFSFSNVGCATKQDNQSQLSRTGVVSATITTRTSATADELVVRFLFATSDGANKCQDVIDRLRQSAVAPSGKLVPDNTRLRLHVKVSRLSCQNCIFFIFYLALTIFLRNI